MRDGQGGAQRAPHWEIQDPSCPAPSPCPRPVLTGRVRARAGSVCSLQSLVSCETLPQGAVGFPAASLWGWEVPRAQSSGLWSDAGDKPQEAGGPGPPHH